MFEEFILAAQQDGVDLKFALLHDSLYFTKQAHAQVLTPVHFRCRGHRWTATVTHHVAGYTHDNGTRNLVYFIDITLPMDAISPLLSEDAEKARIQQEQEQQEEEEEEGQALLGECMSKFASKLNLSSSSFGYPGRTWGTYAREGNKANKPSFCWHIWNEASTHRLAINWENSKREAGSPPLAAPERERLSNDIFRAFGPKRRFPWTLFFIFSVCVFSFFFSIALVGSSRGGRVL